MEFYVKYIFSDDVVFYEIMKVTVDRQTTDILTVWCIQLAICMPEY
jgi:hypothetical protein